MPDNSQEIYHSLDMREIAVLKGINDGQRVDSIGQVAADAGLPKAVTRRIMRSFRERGLLSYGHLIKFKYQNQLGGSGYTLTPLGQKVQHLVWADHGRGQTITV